MRPASEISRVSTAYWAALPAKACTGQQGPGRQGRRLVGQRVDDLRLVHEHPSRVRQLALACLSHPLEFAGNVPGQHRLIHQFPAPLGLVGLLLAAQQLRVAHWASAPGKYPPAPSILQGTRQAPSSRAHSGALRAPNSGLRRISHQRARVPPVAMGNCAVQVQASGWVVSYSPLRLLVGRWLAVRFAQQLFARRWLASTPRSVAPCLRAGAGLPVDPAPSSCLDRTLAGCAAGRESVRRPHRR